MSIGARERFGHEPRRVEKPWGWELVWAEADAYVGKLLFVRAGESLSLQYHERKDEAWLVQEGRARLELGEGAELIQLTNAVAAVAGRHACRDDEALALQVAEHAG